MAFICAIDTVFQGVIASWRDEDGKPCVYETRAEAEADAADVHEDDEPDMVIEVVVTEDKIYDPVDGRVYWTKGETNA
jgi:hypothetical protein